MKLRVHYKYGLHKIRKATSGPGFSREKLDEWSLLVSDNRKGDYLVSFTGPKGFNFSVPAQDIILMEAID